MSGLPREVGRRLLRPWLLHAAGLAAIAIVGFDALRIPIGAPTPEQRPGWPASGESAAALVVDRARLAREAKAPPPFSRRDWSLAWLNTLGQEIGPAALLGVSALDSAGREPARLEKFGLIVLSRGASARLETAPAATLAALARWVEAGGALIAELPGPALAELTGLAFAPAGAAANGGPDAAAGVPRQAPAAAIRPDADLPPARLWRDLRAASDFLPARPGLARLPLHTRLRAPEAVAADVETLATLEGEPFVCARPRGAGLVLAVCADFGLFLTATQQGLPQEDYTVVNRYPEILPSELKTADLMPDLAYHDNDVPVADLLERALVQYARAGAGVPVPALWYWPDGAPGVYLMTHDDEARGARAEWMPADETARGVPSTCYYIAAWGLDGASLGRVAAGGHAIGLHWVRGTADYAMRETWPLPKLGPFLREVTLPGQTARLRQALAAGRTDSRAGGGADAVRHCRLHYLLWDGRWARTFAQLAAAGYELDSSYGPDFHCKGYLFGTAYPFHPLDGNGRPYALFELPYQHSELEAGASGAWLDSLAASSRAGDHAAIVSLFHPPFMAFAPSAEAYRLWRELPGRMAAAGHPAVTMEEVLDFARAREEATLTIERGDAGSVGIEALSAGAAPTPAERWLVSWRVSAAASGLWLTLPARLHGQVVLIRPLPRSAPGEKPEVDTQPGTNTFAAAPDTVMFAHGIATPASMLLPHRKKWWKFPVSGTGSVLIEISR